ncbi:MAG: hypothetical protein WDZ76_11735 [Pseudohongiellaceae bacterium]
MNIKAVLLLLALSFSLPVIAQEPEFNLFDPVDQPTRDERPTAPRSRTTPQNSSPVFTLTGTSRIGSAYSAMLTHRDGQTVAVSTSPGASTAVPGYAEFRIVDINAGRVSLSLPSGTPCMEFTSQGVRCSGGNIAQLSLATGEPLEPRLPSSRESVDDLPADSDGQRQEEAETSDNPFSRLRSALRNADNGQPAGARAGAGGNGNSTRFTPRRIPPEEVPEGMTVISTPFGDRLVEQN